MEKADPDSSVLFLLWDQGRQLLPQRSATNSLLQKGCLKVCESGEDTLGDKNGEDDNSNNRRGMVEEG